MYPPCFPSAVLCLGASLSSAGSLRVWFPHFLGTIEALRLLTMPFPSLGFPRFEYPVLIASFVPWLHPSPVAHNPRDRPGLISIPHRNRLRLLSQWEPVSSPRFLGNPYVHLPCSPTPPEPPLEAFQDLVLLPLFLRRKLPKEYFLSRLYHTAFVLAVYASRFGHPNVQDSLPVGCQPFPDRTFTCWVT